jgi:hypothetical protein
MRTGEVQYNIVNGLSTEGEGWDILLPVDPAVSNPGCTPELLGRETLARLAPEDGEACRKQNLVRNLPYQLNLCFENKQFGRHSPMGYFSMPMARR